MGWETPKTDWASNDGVTVDDLNRIEENTLQLGQLNGEVTHGFQTYANIPGYASGSMEIWVITGKAWSQSAVTGIISPAKNSLIRKQLSSSSWAAGSGSTSPCKAPGTSIGSAQWWYVFILWNPTTDAVDVILDTDIAGANIAGSTVESVDGYTMWRRVGAVKESYVGSVSSLQPTRSMGNWFFVFDSNNIVAATITDVSPTLITLEGPDGVSLTPGGISPMCNLIAYVEDLQPSTVAFWTPFAGSTYARGYGVEMEIEQVVNVGTWSKEFSYLNDYVTAGDRKIYGQIIQIGATNTYDVEIQLTSYFDPLKD